MSENIDKYVILGERCSGNHFLKYAIEFNLELKSTNRNTHFVGYNEFDGIEDIDKTLFICLVRHPIDWIDSFFKRLHHVPPENKKNIEAFLKNEFYSIYELDNKEKNIKVGDEIMEDRNILNGERYKNIFELRKVKNSYFLNKIREKVKHFMILKYEDLRDDYNNTLDYICDRFNIKKKSPEYKPVIKYKGTYNAIYYKKDILLSEEVKQYIIDNIDISQENEIGYKF
jgi:hypothetical protein